MDCDLVLPLANTSCADPKIVYKIKSAECTANPERVENITCSIKAVNWNKSVGQLDFDLVVPLHNCSIQFEVFKKGYSNQYHPFLINATFNVCDIIAKRSFFSYGTLWFKLVREYTNANHTCPFEVN
ncbi:hypothetical protein AWZ03_014802 [Drosophila navojoa]|uniref:MD-2-related lipid-recognition domain-containing protein n=1 Tax=Drosophila navojoa TaxID=7232 RepID=A0A484AQM5_DRONA|nr:hypothetical protein AWZ03_014802 [Drosophila navojoa]